METAVLIEVERRWAAEESGVAGVLSACVCRLKLQLNTFQGGHASNRTAFEHRVDSACDGGLFMSIRMFLCNSRWEQTNRWLLAMSEPYPISDCLLKQEKRTCNST